MHRALVRHCYLELVFSVQIMKNNWWLVDSGAGVTVLSEQTLKLKRSTILCCQRQGCGDEEEGDSKCIYLFDGETGSWKGVQSS